MGKITDALKKVSSDRIEKVQKKPEYQYVVRKTENTTVDEHVVSFHDPMSPVGEQYKILRTNVQSLKYAKNYKTFVITSSIEGEGKTITSLNLAISMAQDLNNKKILLIDADLRKGKVAKYLGIKGQHGLAELLKGEGDLNNMFLHIGVENLTILPAGKTPKNPSELLSSNKMEKILADLKRKFDYIFIDTPPVLPLTDACILSQYVDGVIIAIQAGRTQKNVVKQAETRLYQSRANTLGYVMTKIDYHLPNYLYRYINKYDNYYHYAYKNKKDKKTPKEELV
jgi:capsular exopolysaccharide synthesis family protein